eukprot:1582491-Rhodomonas_salina.1
MLKLVDFAATLRRNGTRSSLRRNGTRRSRGTPPTTPPRCPSPSGTRTTSLRCALLPPTAASGADPPISRKNTACSCPRSQTFSQAHPVLTRVHASSATEAKARVAIHIPGESQPHTFDWNRDTKPAATLNLLWKNQTEAGELDSWALAIDTDQNGTDGESEEEGRGVLELEDEWTWDA